MEKIKIIRTTKSCKVQDQKVYAERLQDGSWEIKNEKEGWTIPADKLFHPMSRYFEKPTWFRKWQCNRSITKWKKKTLELLNRFGTKGLVSDDYGIFLFNKGDKYYFQYREEDYRKLMEFLLEIKKKESK